MIHELAKDATMAFGYDKPAVATTDNAKNNP